METRWDQSKFDAVLKRYLQVCTRDTVTAINTKNYFIARGATRETKAADRALIRSSLLKLVFLHRKTTGRRNWDYGPLIAGIVNKQRGRNAETASGLFEGSGSWSATHGLYGRPMAVAIQKEMKRRNRSVAFLKSGWLPAIRKLEPLSDRRGAPAMGPKPRQFGKDYGTAHPAVDGAVIVSQIINSAIAKRDNKDALGKYGGKGLALAFQNEANSMIDYIEKHLGPATQEANHGLS